MNKKAYRSSTVYCYGDLATAVQFGFFGDDFDNHRGWYVPM
jgi:hypothetical protein